MRIFASVSLSSGGDDGTPAVAACQDTLPVREGIIACLLLIFAVVFNLYRLYPEVAIKTPLLNDGVLHILAFGRSVAALTVHRDPTDPWLAPVAMGYPLFHHYQHLPYVLPAVLYLPFRGMLSLFDLFNWVRYLLLSLFPLSIYWAMRRFGFSHLVAGLGGLVAPLLSTNGLYGLDFASYVWRGYGMYTQLWGMFLLPLALAQGYTVLKTGRGYFWATLLLAATMMSHLVLGYVAFISMALFVFLAIFGQRGYSVWCRGRRLLLLLILVGSVTAYFLLPFVLDRVYMNRSVWEETGKYDAYGHEWALGALIKGELFDFGRFPSLTFLAGVGLILCLCRWREERYRVPIALLILWLLLYFGRPTWGVLLNLLPMSHDLHLHRLIAGVHLGGIPLMGLGLALPWRWALARGDARYLLATAVVTALLLYPVYSERGAYLEENARLMVEGQDGFAAGEQDIAALLETLRRAPPGRVYAGRGGNWGKEYTVGAVPVYGLLNGAGLDTLGYLYHALSFNADVQVLFDESRPEHYNLFNVRYVVAPDDRTFPDFVQPVADFGRHRLYEVATTGYFDLVGSDAAFVRSEDGDESAKADFYPAVSHWLESDLPRAKQHPAVFLEREMDTGDYQRIFPLSQAKDVIPLTSFPLEPSRGHVISETVESNAYLAEIEVERESMLMLKATYHPNWHATVDGVEVATVMLMPSYVGVRVSSGTHYVRLEYWPRPLRSYLLIVGLLLLPLIGLLEWRREELARNLSALTGLRSGWLNPGRFLSPVLAVGHRVLKIASWEPHRIAKERLTPHLPYLGIVALTAMLAGLPLFQFKVMSGHDALEYLPRAVEFYQGLKAGQVFPRWAPDLSAGYGQPFFNFNPPLFYYVSALFRALGFSFVAAQNLACFGLLLLAGVGMYLLAGDVFGTRGGLVSAVAYLFAPHLLVTLYVRHALADFSTFAFLPLAFWGLYRTIKDGQPLFVLVGAFSLALLLLSSNPVSVITFPALLLLLGWMVCVERSWRAFLRGFWCLVLGLGLSAFFWLPALAERDYVHLSRLLEGYLSYRNHFVYLYQLVYSPWGYGLSLFGPGDEMSFAVGPVHLFLVGAALLFTQRIRTIVGRDGLLILFFLVIFLLAVFFTSYESLFLWEQLPLLQYIEFPWRFLSLISVSTALICSFPFLLVPKRGRLTDSLTVIMIAGLFLFGFPHARPEAFYQVEEIDYSPRAIATRDIAVTTAREYEPIWVQERPQVPAKELLNLVKGEGRILSVRLSPTYYEFQAQITQNAQLRVNTFYFPGWTLYVDGAERSVDYDNPQGVIEFSLERGEHLVQVLFVDTPIRLWSMRLSLLALFLLSATFWVNRMSAHHALN